MIGRVESEDRRDQGVSAEDARVRPARPRARHGRQRLVHGEPGGYIGKLDPKTGDVVEYKMPEGVRDPHTPLFAPNGMLFFTAQNANTVGRLDPKTGEIKVQRTPTERANPYGMVFTTKGVPFVCDFGTNKIIEIDPDTLAIKEYPLPNRGQPPAPHRDQPRRHHLVRGLLARLSRPPRSEDGPGDRVAVTERTEVAALRHHVSERRDLVRRDRRSSRTCSCAST